MENFLGGYYLIKLRPLEFGPHLGEFVYTASDCINDSLLGDWAYSWAARRKPSKQAKESLRLSDEHLLEIRKWVESNHQKNLVGWVNLFSTRDSVLEFKHKFFSHLDNLQAISLYFDSGEADEIIEEFKPRSEVEGEIGLYHNLSKHIPEEAQPDEILIGYDLIGIEAGGSFHSFHCHGIGQELEQRFGLVLNKYGLFDVHNDWKTVLDFLNDEENGCEPVPWFVAKTKLVSSNTHV